MAKIFIAESSIKSRENLEKNFEKDGHEYFFYEAALDISEVLQTNQFQVAVIDLNYSKIPAFELIQAFTKNPNHSKTSVIVTTTNPSKEVLNKISSFGVNSIFIKPYRYKLLSEKISFFINPKKSDQGAFEPEVLKIFLESTIHIFESIANISIIAGKPFLKTNKDSLSEVSAVISLSSSQVKGSMSINVSRKILTICLSKMLGSNYTTDKFDDLAINDMCGELCNQIMGKAKQQFLKKKSMTFEISVPTVLSDPSHILDYKSSSPVLVIPFLFDTEQAIFLEFCLEINDSQVVVAPEKLQVMVEEGEFIQF